jgi:hypothetical protein
VRAALRWRSGDEFEDAVAYGRQGWLRGLKEHLDEWLEPQPSLYGMHVTAIARTAIDLNGVADALACPSSNALRQMAA